MTTTRLDTFPLREIVTILLAGQAAGRWRIREDDHWCRVTPEEHRSGLQGWKLHVSATWLSAPLVLHQAARVLLAHGCAFKFAPTIGQVWSLCRKESDRAQAGKFLTAYPRDVDQLRTLAPALDEATAGLPGPAILSDRPLRAGSLVHYRFGAFAGVPVLTNDGTFESRLQAPDGSLVEDVRQPWFCPPEWAELPYEGPPGRATQPPATPRPVLLGGRFRVGQAIRHSARGGVYRATDQQTGQEVVIKQARAHISGLVHGGDARDGLRYESAMLAELGDLAPRQVLLFEDGAHLFLAVEALDGEPLGRHVSRWWQELADPAGETEGPPVTEVLALAGALADVVDAVHARGLTFRDLSPSNVMVLAGGGLKLVDPELVTRPGEWVARAHTPGFAAPELVDGSGSGSGPAPGPGPGADHYALGALLCQLVTGTAPAFTPDALPATGTGNGAPGARTASDRVALLLRYAAARSPAVRRLAPAVLGLTADDPARRWTTAGLREFLAAPEPAAVSFPDGGPQAALEPERQQRLAADGLAYLVATLPEAAPDRLVPTREYGNRSDPCNVQHGAAGVLGVLVRASELTGAEPVRAAAARVARWIDRRRMTVSPLLPGLYFGRSGTAWALHDAARHLEDGGLAERALELAAALPVRWPNPDLTHGTAGAGMAALHLWYETKEPALLERVSIAVDHLLEAALRTDEGRVYWQVPPELDSKLAGLTHLGFAHGVAGIGAFLLAAAPATGRQDARELAGQAGETLAATAVRADGAAYWSNDLSGPGATDLRYHWCSGASGVGTFLVRLWLATGEARYRELAQEAAVTVRRGRWFSGIAACHGLAGNGEFLLDLAGATGEQRYRTWAEELAACLYVRAAQRDGRLVMCDDPAGPVNLDFHTGLAGAVGYLLRLRHGGSRWWMVDAPA